MILKKLFSLFLALASITLPLSAADNNPELISSSLKPDNGELSGLFEGKSVEWRGGKDKSARVTLDIAVRKNTELNKIELSSYAPNKWWAVSNIKITGEKDGKKIVILDKKWYDCDENNGSRNFHIDCPVNRELDKLKIELARPHGYINMAVSDIRLTYANQINVDFKSNWRTFFAGQKCSLTTTVNSTCKAPVQGLLEIIKDGKKVIASREVTIKPGKQDIRFDLTVEKKEKFTLSPKLVLKSAPDNVLLTPGKSMSISVIPPHSKYFMSIGTAHGSAQSGALGFTVRHDWNGNFYFSENQDDYFEAVIREGLVRSNCNIPIEVTGENPYMINAKGEKGRRHSFHAPRHLKEKVKQSMEYWDGHPGLHEVVYYNEHGYHTWHVKGLCDYNPYTLKLYYKWLENKHKNIDTLNALYKSNYKSFDQVEPPKIFNGPDAKWFDWMEFRRYSYGEYLKDAYRLIKPHLKNTQITPKPINFDYYTVSTANDPWLYKDACDVFGYDIYPFQREGYMDPAMSLDFHRTQVGGKKIKFLESNFEFRRVNQTEKTAEDMHLLYWPAFLRGLDGIYFYCWHQHWRRTHSGFWLRMSNGVLTPQGRGAAQIAKEAQTLAPVLKTGKVFGVQAAVYFPWEEISQTPNVAPISALRGAYKILTQLHYQTEFVTWHNILRGDLNKYKVLVLPLSSHMRPEVIAKIDEFVKNGGLLIGEYQAGKYDQYHREQKGLEKIFGIKQNSVYDVYTTFSCNEKNGIKLHRPITKESPFGWRHFPNIRPIPRCEKIDVVNARVLGSFEDKSPAVVTSTYGKGATLYFALTFFNSYRNYFYTLCTQPSPATRGNEIINVGDPAYRKIVKDFLYSHNVKPTADAELYSEDVEDDDSPFLLMSLFGNKHCALIGLTNWGPHERHNVKVWAELPFDSVKKLYCMDTAAESLRELPFEMKGKKINTLVPQLNKSVILIAIKDQGPLLAEAVQKIPGGPVSVKLMNYLPEKASGYLQLRVDGVTEALSGKVSFSMKPGAESSFELPLGKFDKAKLLDASGKRLPWYVWVVYDGDARSFSRVKLPEKMTAP